jgi:hypothetical protein
VAAICPAPCGNGFSTRLKRSRRRMVARAQES